MIYTDIELFLANINIKNGFIGIDYGTSKIGIAIEKNGSCIAAAHSIVQNDKNKFEKILNIISEEKINNFVIGYLFGYEKSRLAIEIEDFSIQFSKKYQVLLFDEGGSSKYVRQCLRNIHGKITPKQLKSYDSMVAARILQNFLEHVQS